MQPSEKLGAALKNEHRLEADLARAQEALKKMSAALYSGDQLLMELQKKLEQVTRERDDTHAALVRRHNDLARVQLERDDLLGALDLLRTFVGVMFGQGPDAVIPETVPSPLAGPPIKLRQLMRDVDAAIAKAHA